MSVKIRSRTFVSDVWGFWWLCFRTSTKTFLKSLASMAKLRISTCVIILLITWYSF